MNRAATLVVIVVFLLSLLPILAVACGDDGETPAPTPPAPSPLPAPEPEEDPAPPDAPPLPSVEPTDNHLPPQLSNMHIGMSLDDFGGLRRMDQLEVVAAMNTDFLPQEEMRGDEDLAELLARGERIADAMDSNRRPDYDPHVGLYYLQETRAEFYIDSFDYQFVDGRLNEVLVTYASEEAAQEMAQILVGSVPSPQARLRIEADEDDPELLAWVFENKLAVADAASSEAADEDAE
ncbi:MAG: hypothetical protein DRJ42_22825 [Deltaproteobacteria bacterium]|nr:MAG: hypothetical protein DRJ42_22825 [Deltaproteobacteria bacterium]